MKKRIKLRKLKVRLTPHGESRRVIPRENIMQFIEEALNFHCDPWPIVASISSKNHVDLRQLQKVLLDVERYGVVNNVARQLIKTFIDVTYRVGVDPIPALSQMFPDWKWTCHKITPHWYKQFIREPETHICIRDPIDSGDIWWHWVNDKYEEQIFEIVAWYHRK